jgi:hypothetical protein
VSLLAAVMIGYPFMYALSPAAWITQEPRYALLALPPLALLLAHSLRRSAAIYAGCGVAALLTAFVLSEMNDGFGPPGGLPNPRELGPLTATLDRAGIDRVISTYWTAYRLTFESDERIIAVHAGLIAITERDGRIFVPSAGWSRNWQYNKTVGASPRVAIVLVRGYNAEPQAPATVDKALRSAGYRRVFLLPFVVYLPPPGADGTTVLDQTRTE